jgi:hypothetical protein
VAWSRGHHHGRHDGFCRSRLITVSEIQTLAGILFTCLPHNWDQGLLAWWIFILFYIIFSSRTSIGLIVYPASPSPVPSPSTWLRSTSSSCDAFPCEHAKMLFIMGSSSQVHRFTGVGAAVADRYCCISIPSAESASPSTHRKKVGQNLPKIPKKHLLPHTTTTTTTTTTLPSMIVVPVSVLLIGGGSLINGTWGRHAATMRYSYSAYPVG